MKKESQEMMNKKDIIYIVAYIFVFLLLIDIFGILSTVENFYFTSNQVSNLLGIIISCVSIVITAYFVWLAIDAFRKIKEIDEAKAKADELIQTAMSAKMIVSKAEVNAKKLSGLIEMAKSKIRKLENYSKDIKLTKTKVEGIEETISNNYKKNKKLLEDASREIGEILISFNESAVVHAEHEKDKNLKESSLRRLYRLSYKYPYLLDEETRIIYIRNLASYGEESDIKQLEKICNSDTEDENIRDIAKIVLEELRNKLKNEI